MIKAAVIMTGTTMRNMCFIIPYASRDLIIGSFRCLRP